MRVHVQQQWAGWFAERSPATPHSIAQSIDTGAIAIINPMVADQPKKTPASVNSAVLA